MENFAVVVTADELKAHFAARVVFHKSRIDWYKQQVKDLEENEPDVLGDDIDSGASNVRRRTFRDQMKTHVSAVERFEFFANHLGQDSYELDSVNLEELEFISSRY